MPLPDEQIDWCQELRDLRAARRKVATGESMTLFRYRQLEEERQMNFSPANLSLLDQLIREADENCQKQCGVTAARPKRFAIRVI